MKKGLIIGIIVLLFAMVVTPALAASLNVGLGYGTATGLGTKDIREGVMAIVKALLGFLGIIAIVIILYGGFVWLTSAGNEEKVGKAKKIIGAAVIGVAIVLAAYIVTVFVIESLFEATGIED